MREAAPRRAPQLAAGLDSAFARGERLCVAAVVLWDLHEQWVVEQHAATRPLTFLREGGRAKAGGRSLTLRPQRV